MKWFKHFSNARFDARVMRLIRKYGATGYGIYFAIVEMIANQLESNSPIPDIEENAQDIAEFFGEDTVKVNEIMLFCFEQGLFQQDENTGRLTCLKLLTHLDNTLSNNPEIKKIINNFSSMDVKTIIQPETSSNFKPLQETSSNFKQIRLDESIINTSNMLDSDVLEIYNKYPSKCPIKNRTTSKSLNDKKKIEKLLQSKSKETIINIIDSYVKDSIQSKTYIKNFATFLNNLPEPIEQSYQENANVPAESISGNYWE